MKNKKKNKVKFTSPFPIPNWEDKEKRKRFEKMMESFFQVSDGLSTIRNTNYHGLGDIKVVNFLSNVLSYLKNDVPKIMKDIKETRDVLRNELQHDENKDDLRDIIEDIFND